MELYKSVCLKCGHALSRFDIEGISGNEDSVQYREYALLGRGKHFLIRSDHADGYIQTSIEELFKKKKLVLILDLDNTLIHTKEIGVDRTIK